MFQILLEALAQGGPRIAGTETDPPQWPPAPPPRSRRDRWPARTRGCGSRPRDPARTDTVSSPPPRPSPPRRGSRRCRNDGRARPAPADGAGRKSWRPPASRPDVRSGCARDRRCRAGSAVVAGRRAPADSGHGSGGDRKSARRSSDRRSGSARCQWRRDPAPWTGRCRWRYPGAPADLPASAPARGRSTRAAGY